MYVEKIKVLDTGLALSECSVHMNYLGGDDNECTAAEVPSPGPTT